MAKLKEKKKNEEKAGSPEKVILNSPKQKTVYSFDPDTKEYTGTTVAHESPLEPGIYHIPAHATEQEPPEHKDKQLRVFKDDKWQYIDDPKFAPEPELTEEDMARNARHKRSVLLFSCDWTQLADPPLTPKEVTAWAMYRKDLRDITKQKGFPTKIEWPEEPK